ncbi:ankyrin repeat-containing protein [Fusarium oxysporum f. sp. phaseoli]
MVDNLALTYAGATGGQFDQQGSIDWIQLARMSVSAPISVLARVSAADVSPLTIVVGQEISSLFKLSTAGHERLAKALSELRSFSAIGDAIWFGFGIKHLVRVLAETNKGLTLLTLCGCLAEIHTQKACAEILIKLAYVSGAPDELRPSASQWINLVGACSGTLKSTTFGCIAQQFMAFYGGYVFAEYLDDAEGVARAFLAVAHVSSGALESVTLTGGRSCGWIAAMGFYFLGLDVEIRSPDNVSIYKSTPNEDSVRILVIYGTSLASDQIQVNCTAYFIKSIDSLVSSYEERFDSIMCGTIHWESSLSRTFGIPFEKLLGAKIEFGALVGYAARVFQGLANSEASSIFDVHDRISWFGFQTSQYGHGFANALVSFFPELSQLAPHIHVDMQMSLDASVGAYEEASNALSAICGSDCCSGGVHSSFGGRGYCLPVLAETIISLVWNLSALQLHADLKPYHSGLRFLYELHAGRASTDASFGERYGAGKNNGSYWGDITDLVRLLDLASVYHTAQFLFTTNLYPLKRRSALTAVSVGGLCFYFDILRNVSDRPEKAMVLHVVPGVIQTTAGREYQFIADKTAAWSEGLLGFDWRDNSSFEATAEFKTDYQAKVTETVGGNISIPSLDMDTGSSDLDVRLFIEESAGGLLVDLHFISLAGTCRVGAYTMLKEIIENSGLVHCAHRNCARLDQFSCDISTLDGEGCRPEGLQGKLHVRRLVGNTLARCVGLLVNREWTEPAILRGRECIPYCIRTAINLRPDYQRSPSYVIL